MKAQLNQIRAWVREGRTDAWIAHQLEVSVSELRAFKREHDLTGPERSPLGGDLPYPDDEDLRARDEELVAERLRQEEERARREAEERARREAEERARDSAEGAEGEGDGHKRRRRRGRRGGRKRRAQRHVFEATFDHGEEGYGIWLDPAVQDDPLYAEHWAGHRPVKVTIEADRIVVTRLAPGDTIIHDEPNADEQAAGAAAASATDATAGDDASAESAVDADGGKAPDQPGVADGYPQTATESESDTAASEDATAADAADAPESPVVPEPAETTVGDAADTDAAEAPESESDSGGAEVGDSAAS